MLRMMRRRRGGQHTYLHTASFPTKRSPRLPAVGRRWLCIIIGNYLSESDHNCLMVARCFCTLLRFFHLLLLPLLLPLLLLTLLSLLFLLLFSFLFCASYVCPIYISIEWIRWNYRNYETIEIIWSYLL